MTCFEGAQRFLGGWVWGCVVSRRGQGLYPCSQRSNENDVAGAAPGPGSPPGDCTVDWRGVTRGTREGASLGWGINTSSASLRTEAHLTRKSSEAARGVFSRIIKKERSYFFHYFWKYCTSKLKSKVHLRATNTRAHAHTITHTHIHHSSLKWSDL